MMLSNYGKINYADLLRSIAISMVLIVHTIEFIFPGAGVGVGVFFALSGFLTTKSLINESGSEFNVAYKFIIRRCLRIFPAFLLYLIIVGIYFYFFKKNNWTIFTSSFPEILLFSRPLNSSDMGSITISVFWTLHVEFIFYLTMPIAFLIFGRNNLKWFYISWFIISLIDAWYLKYDPSGGGGIHWGGLMSIGGFFALINRTTFIYNKKSFFLLICWGLLFVLMFIPQTSPFIWWVENFIAALSSAFILLFLFEQKIDFLPLVFNIIIKFVALVSYSIYLYHGLVIDHILVDFGFSTIQKIILFPFLILITAFVSYGLIERTGIRFSKKLSSCLR